MQSTKVRKDLNVYSNDGPRITLRSVRTLIFLRAVSVLLIKVLTDLKNLRTALFYRHLGPHGPKEEMPLPPEPLRRTQTALILLILQILSILLQTTERRATTIKPEARFACSEQHPKRQSLFRSGRPACL